MSEPDEAEVLARAKTTFAKNEHFGRTWDETTVAFTASLYNRAFHLSHEEREEFLEQARHELRRMPIS